MGRATAAEIAECEFMLHSVVCEAVAIGIRSPFSYLPATLPPNPHPNVCVNCAQVRTLGGNWVCRQEPSEKCLPTATALSQHSLVGKMEEALRTTMNFAPKKYYIFGKLRNLKKKLFCTFISLLSWPIENLSPVLSHHLHRHSLICLLSICFWFEQKTNCIAPRWLFVIFWEPNSYKPSHAKKILLADSFKLVCTSKSLAGYTDREMDGKT